MVTQNDWDHIQPLDSSYPEVLYVALEYLPRGDLRSYLRTARSQSDSDEEALSSHQLVKFALDVAMGMEHLAMAGVRSLLVLTFSQVVGHKFT